MTSSYSSLVGSTSGLVSHWRLGEGSGTLAGDETGANPGSYVGGVTHGHLGALAGDLDTAAGFDGVDDEVTASGTGLVLGAQGALEGWFYLEDNSGVLMRASTSASNAGWILAYGDLGTGLLAYRVGGKTYKTGRTIASIRDGRHHLVLSKSGSSTAYYVDGVLVHSGTGAPSTAAVMPWRVMHSGATNSFARGRADEVAVYDRALSAQQVAAHFAAGAD